MTHPDQHPREHTTGPVEFEPLESRLFMRVEGVDVSLFQGAINWQTLRRQQQGVRVCPLQPDESRSRRELQHEHGQRQGGGGYHGTVPARAARGRERRGAYTDPITDANRFYTAAGAYMTAGTCGR
jgi:hypothetical protein